MFFNIALIQVQVAGMKFAFCIGGSSFQMACVIKYIIKRKNEILSPEFQTLPSYFMGILTATLQGTDFYVIYLTTNDSIDGSQAIQIGRKPALLQW